MSWGDGNYRACELKSCTLRWAVIRSYSDFIWNSNEIYLAYQSIANNGYIIPSPRSRNLKCSEDQKFSLNLFSGKTWSKLIIRLLMIYKDSLFMNHPPFNVNIHCAGEILTCLLWNAASNFTDIPYNIYLHCSLFLKSKIFWILKCICFQEFWLMDYIPVQSRCKMTTVQMRSKV